MTPENKPLKESHIIFIAGLIQFVNMVDFVMVMPLGPDFAHVLNIPTSDIGMIGGIYALAAGIAGLVGSFFLDNYARKRAILFLLVGLSVATLGGAFAWDRNSMLLARIAAGICGGPLASLTIALVSDYVPPQRRGAAMGKVMGAFSVASIVGVPAALELAEMFSWHTPFIATSLLGMGAFIFTAVFLPYHTQFINKVLFKHRLVTMGKLLSTKLVILSYTLVLVSMITAFMIIPNFSAHYQLNLEYPREHLGRLYFIGGIISFFTMRLAGVLIDKTSATLVTLFATALLAIVLLSGFIYYPGPLPASVVFVGFMLAMTTRNIAGQTVFSKIPPPEYRGAYASLQNALIHFGQAFAAWWASTILVEANGKLLHIDTVAWIALGFAMVIPILFYATEKNLKQVH